jgi:hypothetical protein
MTARRVESANILSRARPQSCTGETVAHGSPYILSEVDFSSVRRLLGFRERLDSREQPISSVENPSAFFFCFFFMTTMG